MTPQEDGAPSQRFATRLGLSNNTLARLGLPRGVSRSDIDDDSRNARIERRLGRRLTQSEARRCWCARTPPMPLESRAHYYARGFRLLVCRGPFGAKLEMARLGMLWNGMKVKR